MENVDREHSERKVRKETTTVTLANFTPDDREAKRRTINTFSPQCRTDRGSQGLWSGLRSHLPRTDQQTP